MMDEPWNSSIYSSNVYMRFKPEGKRYDVRLKRNRLRRSDYFQPLAPGGMQSNNICSSCRDIEYGIAEYINTTLPFILIKSTRSLDELPRIYKAREMVLF